MRNKILITVLCVVMSFLNLHAQFTNYITLDFKTFKDGATDFYPMVLNYSVTPKYNGTDFYVVPREGYHPNYSSSNSNPWGTTKTAGLAAIFAHLQTIKDMGFNTIRLTGLGAIDRGNNKLGSWFLPNEYTTTFVQDTLCLRG